FVSQVCYVCVDCWLYFFCSYWSPHVLYTLSLHDALPIFVCTVGVVNVEPKIVTAVPGVCEISLDQRALDAAVLAAMHADARDAADRKSTRLNSSHVAISYAVCCLKKQRWR